MCPHTGNKLYYSCFLGQHLIEWLQKRDANTQVETALEIGQVLVDLGYLNDLSVPSASSSAICSQSDLASNTTFAETKPYRPNVMADNLEEVLNPASLLIFQQPLMRRISILSERTTTLPSPTGTNMHNYIGRPGGSYLA